jgi:hypothetical protein
MRWTIPIILIIPTFGMIGMHPGTLTLDACPPFLSWMIRAVRMAGMILHRISVGRC